jgi:hypothetical protein
MQLLGHDPIKKALAVGYDLSNDPYLEMIKILTNNPLADGISERVVKHIRGCDYDYDDRN